MGWSGPFPTLDCLNPDADVVGAMVRSYQVIWIGRALLVLKYHRSTNCFGLSFDDATNPVARPIRLLLEQIYEVWKACAHTRICDPGGDGSRPVVGFRSGLDRLFGH